MITQVNTDVIVHLTQHSNRSANGHENALVESNVDDRPDYECRDIKCTSTHFSVSYTNMAYRI